MYPVILYTDKNGVCELADFFDELDNSHQKSDQALFKKIYRQIGMLQEQGPRLREPYAKLIKGNSYHNYGITPPAGANLLCCRARKTIYFATPLH